MKKLKPPAHKQKVIMAWSGGKDSALSLHEIRKNETHQVVSLLTTITEDYDRISMHGVRRALLEQQAASLGLPLYKVFIPAKCSNEAYESAMKTALEEFQRQGVSTVAFGDIFLEDLRKYREANLARMNIKGIFPVWGRNSTELMDYFITSGFRGITTCIDSKVLDKTFIGRLLDRQFLSKLPNSVDPCGENGEYHSFVFDGPIFRHAISYTIGEVVLRDSFYYCGLLELE